MVVLFILSAIFLVYIALYQVKRSFIERRKNLRRVYAAYNSSYKRAEEYLLRTAPHSLQGYGINEEIRLIIRSMLFFSERLYEITKREYYLLRCRLLWSLLRPPNPTNPPGTRRVFIIE